MTAPAQPSGMAAAESAYDAVPYESYSYRQTHIANLYTLGRLLGVDPPDFRRARVLELGCGGGGNIIPMADQYPESQFIGIDLSPVQIAAGRELAAEAGLGNIDLRAESILDFPSSAGRFDYIICHGTYSWVPDDVRQKILAILRDHLAPSGLALVSYNTLPGWTAVRGLRDMMLYHSAFFTTPAEKVTQAKALLRLIIDGHGGRASPYHTLIEEEFNAIAPYNDYYVFHEYLEANNQPFYLHEFAAAAERNGLAYLCDADPGVAYLRNYDDSVAKALASVADRVRLEQYLDFVSNRRFRLSILTRHGRTMSATPDLARLQPCWVLGRIRPNEPEPKGALSAKPNLTFTGPNNVVFTAYDRTTAALFLTLARNRQPMTVDELVAAAGTRYGLSPPDPARRHEVLGFVLRLFLSRGLTLMSDPGRQVHTVSARPAALPVARAQARRTARVTNAFHDVVGLEVGSRAIMPLLDGTRDRAALVDRVAAMIGRGDIPVQHDGKPVTDAAVLGPRLGIMVDGVLAALAEEALLIG